MHILLPDKKIVYLRDLYRLTCQRTATKLTCWHYAITDK